MAVKTAGPFESLVGTRHKAPADSAMGGPHRGSIKRPPELSYTSMRARSTSLRCAYTLEASGLGRGEVCVRALFTSDAGERYGARGRGNCARRLHEADGEKNRSRIRTGNSLKARAHK